MRANIIRIANLILAVFLALFVAGYCFAWFGDQNKLEMYAEINGVSDGGYFESGSGSADDPFILTNANHLYNLSWLQNVGRLENQHYYFKLNADITVGDLYIAPIGNAEYPFCGEFNGACKKISGLKVTTDKSLLRDEDPAKENEYEFSNSVGLFGKVSEGGVVKNFILVNPSVEVEENAKYSAYSEDACVVGLAIGDDAASTQGNAAISNIGVVGGILSVQREGYTTKNSIVGRTTLTGAEGGSTQGGNTGYFDPEVIYNVLQADTTKQYITEIDSDKLNDSIDYKLFINRTDSNTENYYLSNKVWLTSTNNDASGNFHLGAFSLTSTTSAEDTGSLMAIYNDEEKSLYDSQNNITGQFYSNAYSTDGSIKEVTLQENKEAILSMIVKPGTNTEWGTDIFKYYLRSGGATGSSGENKILGENSRIFGEDGTVKSRVYDEDGTVKYNSLINLQERSIRFNLEKSDVNPSILMVVSTNNNQTSTIDIVKSSHGSYPAVSETYTPDDKIIYSNDSVIDEFESFNELSSPAKYENLIKGKDDNLTVIYHVLTKESQGAYVITFDKSVRVYYMRVVGVSGSEESGEGSLEGIDFITETDSMTVDEADDRVVFSFTPTGTLIQLSGGGSGAAIIIAFERKYADNTYSFTVKYKAESDSPYSVSPTVSSAVELIQSEDIADPFVPIV